MTKEELFEELNKTNIPWELIEEFEGSMWIRVWHEENEE